MIPKEYWWMKPDVACETKCGPDIIFNEPEFVEKWGAWIVQIKYSGIEYCELVKPRKHKERTDADSERL